MNSRFSLRLGCLLVSCTALLCAWFMGSCTGDDDEDGSSDDTSGFTDDADDDGSPQPGEDVLNPEQSGCLKKAMGEETIAFSLADGALTVDHRNACRQCAWELMATFAMDGDSLTIIEGDGNSNAAACSCSWDVSYRIPNVESQAYQITLKKIDSLGHESTLLSGVLDFSGQNQESLSMGVHDCG